MIEGIVVADKMLSGTLKVWINEECQRCYEDQHFELDELDRMIIRDVNQRLGCQIAIDVLDLDNDDRGVYGIVLIEAAPEQMMNVLEKLCADSQG